MAAKNQDLVMAARSGNVERLRAALESGVVIADVSDEWGWPLLHVAAVRGNAAAARLLWESDPHKDRERLRRAFGLSLQSESKETVEYLLEQGAAPSAVLRAIYLGDFDALRSTLDRESGQLDAKDEQGQTPLHVAANMNLREAAALLIARGADIETRNHRGETPLFRAVSNGAESVVRLLLRNGAQVNTVTNCGQNALHCAATTHRRQLVKLLESRGIDPAFADIHVASALGDLERVKDLLRGDPGLRDNRDVLGATPLYWSAAHRKLDVAEYLLSMGADPNIKEMQGRTAFLCSSQRKDRDMMQLLLKHGAEHWQRS